MLEEKSNLAGSSRPSQKLVLPTSDTDYAPPGQHTLHGYPLPKHETPFKQGSFTTLPTLSKQKRNWRKDPAYIVLLIGICAVLVSGIAIAAVASNIFSFGTAQNASIASKAVTAPPSTDATRPTFPTPGGNQGGAKSGQPLPKATVTPVATATAQPNPTIAPTATVPVVQPTPTQIEQLTVQIDNPPTRVINNTIEPINIATNKADIGVTLVITYNSYPYFVSLGPQTTDANGNVTITWPIAVRAHGHNNSVTAHITAVAHDQNNKGATSQAFTIQVIVRSIVTPE